LISASRRKRIARTHLPLKRWLPRRNRQEASLSMRSTQTWSTQRLERRKLRNRHFQSTLLRRMTISESLVRPCTLR
jgi:hypothetical protein